MSSPSSSRCAHIQMVLNFLVAHFDEFERHQQEVGMYQFMQLRYCYELRQLAVEMIARAKNANRRKQNRLMQSVFGTTRPLVPTTVGAADCYAIVDSPSSRIHVACGVLAT
ncbi:hypothetical protein J3F84DRAFT_376275 [Trichoderma pleuroticola]